MLEVEVLLAALMWHLHKAESMIQVEIACVGPAYPSSSAALAFLGPAYRMGSQEVNRRHAGLLNLTMTFLRGLNDIRSCPPMRDVSIHLITEWYYTKRLYPDSLAIILTPGCLEVGDAHQLTANWNVIYINTAGGEKSPYKLPAAPIITTAYISLPDIARAFVDLLLLYDWTSVYMVVDLSSPPIYYYLAIEVSKLDAANPRLKVFTQNISSMDLKSYNLVLDPFKQSSRVMLFLGHAAQLRQILIEASYRNMTNGDYVYIGQQGSEYKFYGNFTWKYEENPDQDEVARHAFRSLLLVHPYEMLQAIPSFTMQFLKRVREIGVEEYNISYTSDQQPPRETMTAYSTIAFVGQVINRTLAAIGPEGLFNSLQFAEGFLNETYRDLFGDIFMDKHGLRRIALAVSTFATNLSNEPLIKQAFLVQLKTNKFEFTVTKNMSQVWPGGRWPPPNQPRCGYSDDLCHDGAALADLVAALSVVCFIAACFVLFLIR